MLFSVKELHVQYGSVQALQGTSLDVDEGEIVGLVGHNGVGKSSLLGAAAGIVQPTDGEILFQGEPSPRDPGGVIRAGISFIPEDRRIFQSLSVGENLRLGATARSDRDAVEADYERELERFPALREFQHHPAGVLSGGQQQMLAISRGLISKPKLLLLDEPTLGLAPLIINQIFHAIEELGREGVAVLLVEQNVAKTLAVASRTYVMGPGGRIEFEGRSNELEASPDFRRSYLRLGSEADSGGGQ